MGFPQVIQIMGILKAVSMGIVLILGIIFGAKIFAIAPHAPDIGLRAEHDYHREATQKDKEHKANVKVQKYDDSKAKGNKDKKSPKPSKQDKKNATKHKKNNLS